MPELTKRERVRAALAGAPVDRPPVALWGHDPANEWAMDDLVASTLESYRAHDWDFIKFNPRASYFAEAWGNRYERTAGDARPRLVAPAVEAPEDLARLKPLDPRAGLFGEHLEALRRVVEAVHGEVDVLHTVFSPLAVAGGLTASPQRLIELAAADPAAVHAALSAITETVAGYGQAAIEAGAAGLFYAPLRWASRDTCDEDFYREFGRPYDLQALGRVREAEFNVLHVCGDQNMLELLLDYPVAAFNWADHGLGNASLDTIRDRTTKAVIGGIDQRRLPEMTASEVTAHVQATLASGAERLCVGPGCTVPPETLESSRAAVALAVREA